MLSHLLAGSGIDNVVVDNRDHETIRTTHRAGILEHGSVNLLVEYGVSDRVLTAGHKHEGIDLRFGGQSHRIDFPDLVGEAVWLYPQNEVFVDLAAARRRDGGDVRFGVSDTAVRDLAGTPHISFTDADSAPREIHAEILVGADGSQGITKWAIPAEHRTDNFIEYPFAWFGILCEAPPSAEELIYAHSRHGFALISQRDANIQRMYFQCSPDEDAAAWSEDPVWAELQKRVDGPDGLALQQGKIIDKTVLRFRSYVCEPMRYGNLFLAGDAGHTVPPSGAKGLNLAFADARVLFEGIQSWAATGSRDLLDRYGERALDRVWRAQNFSYWMTSMLHTRPGANPFEHKRQLGELTAVVNSRHGSAYLAEAYTGWPAHRAHGHTARSKRFIPISEPAERLLRRVHAAQAEERRLADTAWRQTGSVFTSEFGEPCDPRDAFRALRAAATKAGLSHAGPHTLRHSAARVMLTKGVPLKVISDILGHSSIAITGDIYGHVSPDVARQAMDTLGDAFDRVHRATTPSGRRSP